MQSNDPDYSSETQKAHWNPACNFDDTGDSAYAIDLADLDVFCDEWLWTACWKQIQMDLYGMFLMGEDMLFGGEMQMEMLLMEPMFVEPENPYTNMPIDELISLVTGIDKMLEYIDSAIAEDTENLENWLQIKDFLEEVVADIKTARQ